MVKNTHLRLQYFNHWVHSCPVKTFDVHRIDVSTQSLTVCAWSCCLWCLVCWSVLTGWTLDPETNDFSSRWGCYSHLLSMVKVREQKCLYSFSLSLFRFTGIWTLPQRQYYVSCFIIFDNFTCSDSLPCWNSQIASLLPTDPIQPFLLFQILTGLKRNFKLLPRKLTSTGVFMALF